MYERFQARFEPQRRDDLKPGLADFIGRVMWWERSWLITEEDGGDYVGDYACVIQRPYPEPHFPYAWVPECDLVKV